MKLFRWTAISIGSVIAVAHIGVLGHLIKLTEQQKPQYPSINIPSGEYTSYEVNVNQEGYNIRYNANDPKVLVSERTRNTNSEKNGIFGGRTSTSSEWRRDEYTAEGARNIQGTNRDEEGKLSARDIECIQAEGGGRSSGAIVGTSIASAGIPLVSGIPYVGWLATGWLIMLGSDIGSETGAVVSNVYNDC